MEGNKNLTELPESPRRHHNCRFDRGRFLPIPDNSADDGDCLLGAYTCIFSAGTCRDAPSTCWNDTCSVACFARRLQIMKRDVMVRKCLDKPDAWGKTITLPCLIRQRPRDNCEAVSLPPRVTFDHVFRDCGDVTIALEWYQMTIINNSVAGVHRLFMRCPFSCR